MTETTIGVPTASGTAPQPAPAIQEWPPLRQAYGVAWILAVVQACALFNNGVMTLLVESVKRDLNLSDMQMSYLLGFSVVLFYAFVGIPAARLVDRHNRKWLMTGSIAVWSVHRFSLPDGSALRRDPAGRDLVSETLEQDQHRLGRRGQPSIDREGDRVTDDFRTQGQVGWRRMQRVAVRRDM